MSRAARRRAEREARKTGGTVEQKPPQAIQLKNPVTDQFEVFIFGNSLKCEYVVEAGSMEGQTVVICGAGPSLADDAAEWCHQGDQVWGCNSALTWLIEHGYPVTHGITVDQTPAMLTEWWDAPDVEYLVASTIHPHLTEHLLERGRRLTWFHNFVGLGKPPVMWCACGHDHEIAHIDGMDQYVQTCAKCDCAEFRPRLMSYEDWLYLTLYPPTLRAGSGLNTVNRAVDLALAMGFDKVIVLGADCALRVNRPLPKDVLVGSDEHRAWLETETVMHADGGNALASGATPVTLGGEIDGRWWESKPDMLVSAVFLVQMQRTVGEDRLLLVGDTLPNALKDKPDEFLDRMPTLLDSEGEPIRVRAADPLLTAGAAPL